MNIHHTARHIGIVGKSGFGKTTYGLKYIAGSHHKRVFVFDHQGEFSVRLGVAPCYTPEQIQAAAETRRHVVFDPSLEWGGEFQEAFDWFCDAVYSVARDALCPLGHPSLFVCDELQKFVNDSYCPPEFRNIIETGRRQMLDTLSLSQRPNGIPGTIREQWTELVSFRLNDENSLKFAKSVGIDTAAVSDLPKHSFLFYNVVSSDERKGQLVFDRRGDNAS